MVSLFGEDVGERVEDLITPDGDQQLLDGVTDTCHSVRCLLR